MALPKLDTPTYELKIPSTGERVSYRPYLVKEEKILMIAMESDDSKQMISAVKNVIRSCTNGSVDVNRLAMFDIEYIFTQLRSASVGETSTIGVKCESCSTKNEVDVNLQDVRVDIPEDREKTVALTDTIGVILKYPSVEDMLEKQGSKQSNVEQMFDIIESCIESIYTEEEIFNAAEQSKTEIREFIESLNTQQFNELRKFVESIPSATIDVEFTCASCGEHNSFEVKGLGNFFA